MTCSSCSAENPSESRFCIRCGSPLEEAPAPAETAPTPTYESPESTEYSVQPTSAQYDAGAAPAAPPAVPPVAPPAQAAPPDPVAALYNQVEYAGFLIRFVAAFLDGILITVVNYMITIPIYLIAGVPLFGAEPDLSGGAAEAFKVVAVMGITTIISIVLNWLYEAVLISSERQATFGKQAFGIRVTDLDGNRISFGRATGRHFAKWISMMTLLIGYLIQPITEKKQALHDIIAGTLVVKKPLR